MCLIRLSSGGNFKANTHTTKLLIGNKLRFIGAVKKQLTAKTVKQRIYIDTSVFGGYFDEEFSEHTIPLFDRVKDGEFIEITDEAFDLATEYIAEKVVGKASFADCLHIALATTNRADFLVSWNFKHIVNIQKIRGYNSINIKNGYKQLEIRSPREFEKYENN